MTIDQAFNQSAVYYDDWVKKAVPCYEEMFAVATELIPFEDHAKIDVLDLGAGTGLFSKHVLERYPRATFVLYDVADRMLEAAQDRFLAHRGQFTFTVGDYRNIQGLQDFDLVISSLSIHHLPDDEKRDLFSRIYTVLREDGVFINIDQIRGRTSYLQELYWKQWLRRIRKNGASEDKIQESIHRRRTFDQDASLSDQLQWLRCAGFVNVDCVYKHYFIGVFFAMK